MRDTFPKKTKGTSLWRKKEPFLKMEEGPGIFWRSNSALERAVQVH